MAVSASEHNLRSKKKLLPPAKSATAQLYTSSAGVGSASLHRGSPADAFHARSPSLLGALNPTGVRAGDQGGTGSFLSPTVDLRHWGHRHEPSGDRYEAHGVWLRAPHSGQNKCWIGTINPPKTHSSRRHSAVSTGHKNVKPGRHGHQKTDPRRCGDSGDLGCARRRRGREIWS